MLRIFYVTFTGNFQLFKTDMKRAWFDVDVDFFKYQTIY